MITMLVLAMALVATAPADAGTPQGMYSIRERFGVNVARTFSPVPDFPGSPADFGGVEDLGFGWWSDWSMTREPWETEDIEFAQIVRGIPGSGLENTVRANPGSLWIIGNEPETGSQDGSLPWVYAEVYHDLYYRIKAVDPTAKVAIGGVVMPTPLRLEWLERCLKHYKEAYLEPMPVDVWNIHVQILQEKSKLLPDSWGCGIPVGLDDDIGRLYTVKDNFSVSIFRQLVLEFRQWMYAQGEGHKPLIITEYGILMPSSYVVQGDQRVLSFMQGTFDFLMTARDPVIGCADDGGRLVQRWMWFSLNFPSYDEFPEQGFNGGLYRWDRPDELTAFGAFYRDYVRDHSPHIINFPLVYQERSAPEGHNAVTRMPIPALGSAPEAGPSPWLW